MKYSIFTIMIVSVIFYSGCTDSSTSTNPPIGTAKGIIPLAIGNTWARFGSIYNTTSGDTSYFHDYVRILRDTVFNDSQWFIMDIGGAEFIVSNLSDGLYLHTPQNGSTIWYKYPAAANDTINELEKSTLWVAHIDTSITVPAGTFNCYRYDLDVKPTAGYIGGSKLVLYASPDIGFIKYETYYSTNTSAILNLGSKIEITNIVLK